VAQPPPPDDWAARERAMEARHATELQAARRRVIEAGDTARQRLARDLHDGAQQHIVTALIKLRLAQQTWDEAGKAKLMLDAGILQADEGLAALRELAAGIHPALLTHRGLAAAVEDLAATAPIPTSVDVLEQRLPPPLEASIYFFVTEALTNVMKHAHATSAHVRIAQDAELVTIDVGDDGAGGADASAGGTGLTGLGDRIDALQGDLTVTSEAGAGTTLSARIPLDPASPAG
jgi:signal transduction histidine kinase